MGKPVKLVDEESKDKSKEPNGTGATVLNSFNIDIKAEEQLNNVNTITDNLDLNRTSQGSVTNSGNIYTTSKTMTGCTTTINRK